MSYGTVYKEILDSWSDGRMQIATGWKKIEETEIGEWVIFLRMDIVEGMPPDPQMAKIEAKYIRNDLWQISTSLGSMWFNPDEMVQVVI